MTCTEALLAGVLARVNTLFIPFTVPVGISAYGIYAPVAVPPPIGTFIEPSGLSVTTPPVKFIVLTLEPICVPTFNTFKLEPPLFLFVFVSILQNNSSISFFILVISVSL